MTRAEASKFCRETLDSNGLTDWHVRLNQSSTSRFLGLCSYKDKCIILSAHSIDIHPDPEIQNTIRHEVAHALTPGHQHDNIWANKAREIGCTSVAPCSHLTLSPDIIDAIRSGADVVVTYETEVIHRPKYEITRLQDKCPICHKVAREVSSKILEHPNELAPNIKVITLECGHTISKEIPKGTPFQTLRSDDGKKPFPFQVEGMKFVEAALSMNKGACVFDEMGLGKTVQALGYLRFHPEAFPVLFIVKSGIKYQWFSEVWRWLGDAYIPQVIDNSNETLMKTKCYIISYDMLVAKSRTLKSGKVVTSGFDIEKFKDIKTVVCDECQQIKNPDATRTQQVRRLVKDKNVIGLSGTPWKNRGSELFSILNMVSPVKFDSYQRFLNRWVDYYYSGVVRKEGGIRRPKEFREFTKDILIRRERTEVMPELPLINRTIQYTELDAVTQNEYDGEVSEFVKWWNDKVIGGTEDETMFGEGNLLAKLARMRHITGLAKIPATVEYACDFIESTDRKLVIFVHHIDVGELIYRELIDKLPNIKILRITSDMNSQERYNTQEEFNKLKQCIMIGSTLASGEGLNLQTCSDCIMHERQWNPANEEQAEGRFIRIGQTASNVNGVYITAAGTVDEFMAKLVEAKRAQFHETMNKGEMPVWNQGSLMKELAQTIVDHAKPISKVKKMAMM
jgi:SNF2 family DNA or RNA helicase